MPTSLLEPELQEVYARWKMYPGPETNAALAGKIGPWVDHALLAAGGDSNNKALVAKARMLAINSLSRYDPQKATMKNYLYAQLKGLHRVVGNDANIIKIPERTVLGVKRINETEREFYDTHGRFPSTSELADSTGFSARQIEKWRQVNLPVNTGSDTFEQPGMQRVSTSHADTAWMEYVYDMLPERRKVVMERLYGLHGFKPKQPAEIAKELKISPAAISQHRKAIDKLISDDSRYTLFGD